MTAIPDALRWVVDGWYANNPHGQKLAIQRALDPVTTAAEREAVKNFPRNDDTAFACSSCGRFAFCKPTLCHWCR